MFEDCDFSVPKKWLRITLTIIPLVIVVYTIFWTICVTHQMFINAIGFDCTIAGSGLIVSSLFSSGLAIFGLKNYETKGEFKFKFFIYVCFTLICFLLLILALMYTSVTAQGLFELIMEIFSVTKANFRVTNDFDQDYISKYDKMKYFFLAGRSSHDFYMVVGALWIACFLAYFVVTDAFEGKKKKAD